MAQRDGAAALFASLKAGIVILAAGLLAVPTVGGVARLILQARGWTFEPVWQSASFTMAMVWIQNGMWIAGSALVLSRVGAASPAAPPLAAAGEGRRVPPWTEAARGRSPSAWLKDVGVGVGWGFMLLFVNAFAARIGMAIWERILSPEQVAERIARERGPLLQLLEGEWPPWMPALLLFTVAVVAPLGEELLFRGIIHRALYGALGRRAAWLSGAMFAAAHLYAVHFLAVWILGMLLARLYERRGSLVAPIVAHGVVNGLVALAQVALRASLSG